MIEKSTLEIAAMIEFKGIYYNDSKKSPMAVLIQFDGQLLHVWHLTDPFYKLRSSSRFSIKRMKQKRRKIIKFPDGACIESENDHAMDILLKRINTTSDSKCFVPCKKGTLIFIVLMIILLISAGWSIFL